MAASLKVSELSALSSVAASDLFLIADVDATASKKVTLTNLEGSMSLANLGTAELANLSNVASTAPSSGQVLAWNGSSWAPAASGHSTQASLGVDHLITLSGVAEGSDDLGTFSGSTINDSVTVKSALQALETAVESASSAAATVATTTRSTDATHYLTFVDSDNGSSAEEAVYTDAGIAYNPSSNLLTVGELSATTLDIGGTDITATAAELNYVDGVTSSIQTQLDGKLANVAEDTSPQLGGDLDLSSSDIIGNGNIDITGTIQGTTVEATTVYVDVGNSSTDFENVILTTTGTDGQGSLVTDIDRHLSYRPSDNTFWSNRMINPQRTAAEELTIFPITNMTGYESDYTSAVKITAIKDEDDMSSDSATSLVTQQSVKAYVDTKQATITDGDGLLFTGATLAVDLKNDAVTAVTLTGLGDSIFNTSLTKATNPGNVTFDDFNYNTGTTAYFYGSEDTSGNFVLTVSSATNTDFNGVYVRYNGFKLDTATIGSGSAQFAADSTYDYFVKSDDKSIWCIYSDSDSDWVLIDRTSYSLPPSDNSTTGLTGPPTNELTTWSGETNSNSKEQPATSEGDVAYSGGWPVLIVDTWWRVFRTWSDPSTWSADFDDVELGSTTYSGYETVDTTVSGYEVSTGIYGPGLDDSNVSSFTGGGTDGSFLEFSSSELQVRVLDEDNMSSNSDTHLATQQSIKQYVDSQLVSGSGAVETAQRSVDAAHYLTFVQDDNSSATAETLHTDAGVVYNPSSNLLTVGALTVSGDLTIQGTTTNISSTTITVDDKNIELGSVDTPTDTTADGGGITLKGATDKTINWINSTDNWTSSEDFDLVSGKEYKISNSSVLSATTLGSGVVNSSLTNVGTLTALAVSGTTNLTGTFQLGGVSVTSTAAELNILDGVTSTATELNLLDGVTATTAELNYVDGVTSNVQTQLDAKQATVTAGDGLAFSGATLAVDLSSSVVAQETLTLSGMSDSNHNDTYSMVYRSGTRLLATADQSGASIKISIEREAEFSLSVSGTSVSAIDDGGALTVHKHTGYLTNSGNVWTWATGSDGGDFHWFYWDTTDDILVAWDGTNNEWKAFDLGEATGNVASFISDLDSTGSQAGYVSSGENFTLTSGNIASLTSVNDTYPGTSIIKVPDGADSNITYGSASSHPYYVYQNSDAKKWILFSTDSSYYWTAWYRSTAFDLTTETLTDDATAFNLDNTSHFEFITANSDTYNGNNIPDADDSDVTYATAASGAYLEIASNKLQAKVKDEDDMSSDSADHTATQQSVKAYVDTTTAANETHIDNLVTLSGAAKDATNLGTFTGSTIADSSTIKASLQALETAVEAAEESSVVTEIDTNVDDLITLSGVAENTANLGTFTGTIIADTETIKGALQDLEDELGNITLTNLDIDGATAGTIADASLFVIDEGADGTNKKVTASSVATYVAGEINVKGLAAASTSADTEPTTYLHLILDTSDGSIKAIDKTYVETE